MPIPSILIAGSMKAKVIQDDPQWIEKDVLGEFFSQGNPPSIKIKVKDNPLPGETIFHELSHLVEYFLGKDYLPLNSNHNVFISVMYHALKQNGFLATCLICQDFVE